MDWDAEGLLDGLDDAHAREARAQLLDELAEAGVPAQDLRRAVEEDRLVLLPIELSLLSLPRLTVGEVAEQSGLTAEQVIDSRRAMGLPAVGPEDRVFGEEDVEAAKRLKLYFDSGMPPAELLALLRVQSGAVMRAADGTRAAFVRSFLEPGDTELDLAHRYQAMSGALMPLIAEDLDYMMRVHLREFARNGALGVAERDSGRLPQTSDVAVAFADLVGFTALGESLPEVELGQIADRLTDLALDRIKAPVRLVKTIGDAVMLVSPQPEPLVDFLLELVEAADADEDLPPLRAGAAWGSAYPRLGDWYGNVVNLASRVAGRARPGAVLVTPALHDALGDDGFEFSYAGPKRLKGVHDPVEVWRVRRRRSGA
jgi:adenylate cyclase